MVFQFNSFNAYAEQKEEFMMKNLTPNSYSSCLSLASASPARTTHSHSAIAFPTFPFPLAFIHFIPVVMSRPHSSAVYVAFSPPRFFNAHHARLSHWVICLMFFCLVLLGLHTALFFSLRNTRMLAEATLSARPFFPNLFPIPKLRPVQTGSRNSYIAYRFGKKTSGVIFVVTFITVAFPFLSTLAFFR
jgi:hypothetical protein